MLGKDEMQEKNDKLLLQCSTLAIASCIVSSHAASKVKTTATEFILHSFQSFCFLKHIYSVFYGKKEKEEEERFKNFKKQ